MLFPAVSWHDILILIIKSTTTLINNLKSASCSEASVA
jgi:hypothetical protein